MKFFTFARRTLVLLYIAGALFLLPIVAGLGFGIYFLISQGGILTWALILLVSWLAAWKILAAATRKNLAISVADPTNPEPFWDDNDNAAWQKVLQLSNDIETGAQSSLSVKDFKEIIATLSEQISSHYFPTSSDPLLEVKIAELFLTAEYASKDLRELLLHQIPFHDILTINDIFFARRGYKVAKKAHAVYRIFRPVANPGAAVIGEMREFLARKAVKEVSKNSWCFINARMTEHAGKHLINLYSGKIAIKDGGEMNLSRPEFPRTVLRGAVFFVERCLDSVKGAASSIKRLGKR
jgi:hypothetical protein